MEQEIIEAQPQAVAPANAFNVEALISEAIKQGTPVDTMERILAMRRELKAEFAKEEFDRAMAKFQSECPVITKTKEVKTKSGVVAYRYAPIESIVEQVKVPLQANGFSYSTNMELLESGVKVSVKVTHAAGHSELTQMSVPLGTKTDIMSASQVVAAAQTFAKRYAFCNAFGILTGDEDNDAVSNGEPNTGPATRSVPYKEAKLSNVTLDFIRALEEATTVEEYEEVSSAIKQANDSKAVTPAEFKALIASAKTAAGRIKESLKPKPTPEPVIVEVESPVEPKEESAFAKAVKKTSGAKFVNQ